MRQLPPPRPDHNAPQPFAAEGAFFFGFVLGSLAGVVAVLVIVAVFYGVIA